MCFDNDNFISQEPCSFSLRQIQLAKHTPSEIIMLAFLCATLEQCPCKLQSSPSKRLDAITYFLEEAVKVVPIESILYAIGYDELDTAVECANALLNANPTFPSSREATIGMQKAIVRMRTGIHGADYDVLIYNLYKQLGISSAKLTATESPNELLFVCDPPIYMPLVPVVQGGLAQPQIVDGLLKFKPHPNRVTFPQIANKLHKFSLQNMALNSGRKQNLICGLSIEHVYPIHSIRRHSLHHANLKSPIEILRNARDEIATLLKDPSEDLDMSSQGTQLSNERMLSLFKEIADHNVKLCASLIGSFMEQQIQIPFFKSEEGTAYKLSETHSPVAMGAWALFSLTFDKLHQMVAGVHGNPLLVEIADYISLISSDKELKKTSNRSPKYSGKLQFLLQGMKSKTVTCSNKYISYSLEHQLCSNLKFDKDIAVKTLIKDWDKIFKGDALSLIATSHRSLVARWLKWVVLVHDLRESLAKYTCVGVTGLINSGKSFLVSRLFGIEVCTIAK